MVLAAVDADQSEHYARKKDVENELEVQRQRIQELQARQYAENKQGLLIVLQAMDTGGKDGTIKHVFSGVNPQGCRVSSFKAPNPEEANHDFLWRYHKSVPARGRIGIFNRSHYEDVLVVRVKNLVPEEVWRALRADKRLRVQPHPGRYRRHQVLPAHLKGRAEAASGEPARRPGQEVEVFDERHQGARLLGRLSGGL